MHDVIVMDFSNKIFNDLHGLEKVYVHAFLDGRDTPPASACEYLEVVEKELAKYNLPPVASVIGRYYIMDRDNRWDRVEKAYDMMTLANGKTVEDAEAYVRKSYENGVTDEFVIPAHVVKDGKPVGLIENGDSIIFFNFRPDRARQITRAMSEKEFDGFDRKSGFINPAYVCFTRYDASFTNVRVAFKPQVLTNTLGEYIASLGLKQLRIAETEKYAHVTFFFNGGVEKPNSNEDRELIPSPKVATYDLKPEMSAPEVGVDLVEAIKSDKYDVIIINYANPDMVGHTGSIDAAVRALETINDCVAKVVEAVKSVDGVLLITADHGNAEQMIDYKTGEPYTAHTTNPVPLAIVGLPGNKKVKEGRLADLAPTMLDIMGLEKPDEMTGESLIV